MTSADDGPDPTPPPIGRRSFLSRATGAAMAGGLCAGYGAFGLMAGRFLYPAKPDAKSWLYVSDLGRMKPGDSLTYVTPTGATVAVARQGAKGDVSDFIALSSTCPHLGCKVHWEQAANRFFCPCHNGAFDAQGAPISGPPKEANQPLPRFPLKVEDGLLYIESPLPDDVERRARRRGGPSKPV